MNARFDYDRFHSVPLIGILRHSGALEHEGFVEAVLAGGFTSLEVSFTHADAPEHLARLREAAAGRLNLGAGTITTVERLRTAFAAGASFVVTPVVAPDVVAACVSAGVPVFPGAFTPSEAVAAQAQGATMVKLFPAASLGPQFVTQIKAALPELRVLPTGGIARADISRWRRAGADGLGLGGGLFPAPMLASRAWAELAAHIRTHVDAWEETPADFSS
jgi:2-dehydro-3-deoxyphosphogluconate aldolase/(4S)-4-hydroxy-2-oxoglutarate aldolase